jgi:hypothetical protein
MPVITTSNVWRISFLLVLVVLVVMVAQYAIAVRNPCFKLFVGFTKHDVQSALGQPNRVYGPNEDMGTYGAHPPPPPKGNHEVWVYVKLMKLTFVYFDEHGRVRMVFFTVT